MKKINNLSNSRLKEGQEKSKKIYRSISDLVKSLDDARTCASHIKDLFVPSIQVQRSKLQEYCEWLIFNDPTSFGTKVEELLWRKTYYEVISAAKKLKKQEYTLEEKTCLHAHINAGIGHYHHYISRLQTEFEINFEGDIDFFILEQRSKEDKEKEVLQWCITSVHKSLIYLGDLSRYKLEIYPNWDPNLAFRYYSHALLLKPEHGMPHNQMGTLSTSLNQHLDAAYYYIQCMMSKVSFEGTENNLRRLFERNAQYLEQLPLEPNSPDADCIVQLEQTEQIKRFTARFLLLADVWFFNKKIPHVYDLCHQTNIDLQECLSFLRPAASESSGSQNGDICGDSDSISSASYLSADMTFKIIVICLQCITKLQGEKNSVQLSNVIAFTLAMYSQLLQHVSTRLQETVLNCPAPETSRKKRIQRRKKLPLVESDDEESEASIELSDESDTDEASLQESNSSSDDDADEGEPNECAAENAADKIDTANDTKDVFKEAVAKVKLLNPNVVVDIVAEETYFEGVKLLSDWLRSDLDVLKNCGKNTRSLFVQLGRLLNLINVDLRKIQCAFGAVEYDGANGDRIPLDEDVLLKGLEVLGESQKSLDWSLLSTKTMAVGKRDKVVIRIGKMLSFGRFLESIQETGVSYNNKTKQFCVEAKDDDGANNATPPTIEDLDVHDSDSTSGSFMKANREKPERENKRELMKNMGQLWLAAEVRDLESRVRGKMSLSPHLVVDVDSLIKHMDKVKHLVHSRKFLILVPTAVFCALDDLKKLKSEAREAIRWLESQFRQGNRFFRPQRAHERLPIPYVKYPKKKDKEAHIYIQTIECCHYLAEHEKGDADGGNLVTLLIGDPGALNNTEGREISYVGLAQSGGINLELITEFYAKWKKTGKGKR